MGVGALCFEGNIDFYGKSGFDYVSSFGIRYHGLQEGEYSTPECYFVDEAEAERFDETFPEKKKEKNEGQIFKL